MSETPQEKMPAAEKASGPEKLRGGRTEEARAHFQALASEARRKTSNLISKRQKLIANLRSDLEKHGEPEQWKRFGDLILANMGTAVRRGDQVIVTDYFDQAAPTIEIDAERQIPLNEVAEGYFRRYVKARNGKRFIAERIESAEADIERHRETLVKIEAAIQAGNAAYLEAVIDPTPKALFSRQKKKVEAGFKGARRFVSSDGFEILVGRKAKDNDFLTFRVAKSLDLWLHAADYPGSHVVVRNDRRREIPNKTLLEAAQLAAFYSDAREKPKAAVNYTEKKFVNKPKRSAPGLVRLASFRTILVEPQVPEFKLTPP